MTLEELRTKVRSWDLQNSGDPVASSRYEAILHQLSYHAAKEWRVYLPAQHSDFNASYLDRLAAWVGNVTDEVEQKLLLEYANYISFFSHEDFIALYQTALNRNVTQWIVSQIGAKLHPHGAQVFRKEVLTQIDKKTWFCPVTDSMDINEFYKVNHLKGIGHRPGFSTLHMLAEKAGAPNTAIAQNIVHYMANPSLDAQKPTEALERLVLLEDVVGSGTQCLDAVNWAVANLGKPVLFVPLILCPNGVEALRIAEQASNGRLTVRPVVELRRSDLLGPERQGQQGWRIANDLEQLAHQHRMRASASMDTFGYRNTGCSLATFANTPDNTLPIVHNHRQGSWTALFPRVYRD